MQIPLNKDELALLRIIQSPSLTNKAIRLNAKGVILFNRLFSPHLDCIWTSYLAALMRARTKGVKIDYPKDRIAAECMDAVSARTFSGELQMRSSSILEQYINGVGESEADGEELLKHIVTLDAQRKLSAQITGQADLETIRASVESAQKELATNSDAAVKEDLSVFCLLSSVQRLMTHQERLPTGLSFLDKLSNGGGRAKELWLIMANTGGGKTVLTAQYCVAQAYLGNHTAWASFEQDFEHDITERVVANITRTDISLLRDKAFDALPAEIQEKYWTSVAGCSEKIHALDMTREDARDVSDPADDGGMYTVWKKIKQLKASGVPIKALVVDWFGEMLMRVAANRNIDLERQFRFLAGEQIAIARRIMRDEDVLVIFLHQLNTECGAAKPTYHPERTDALNMKTLANNMDLAITLGKLDRNMVCNINAVKTRKGMPISLMVQLVGKYSRFEEVFGWLPNRDGHYYKPGDDATYMAQQPSGSNDHREDAAASYKRELV